MNHETPVTLSAKLRSLLVVCLFPVFCQAQGGDGYREVADGVEVDLAGGTLRISVLAPNAARVRFWMGTEPALPELVLTTRMPIPAMTVTDSPAILKVQARDIVVSVDKRTGVLSFADGTGTTFLREKAARVVVEDSVGGERCFRVEQRFDAPPEEHLFGLGQFQDGFLDLRGATRRLTQVNTQIAIPMLYSSRGYGLLWHQYGLTDFNPADSLVSLTKLPPPSNEGGAGADVTTTSGTRRMAQDQARYQGTFVVPADGAYSLFLDLGDMGNRHFVAVDGKPCIDQTNLWLPPTASARVPLAAGIHHVEVVCRSSNTPRLSWKRLDEETVLRSPHAKGLDYVVFSGPSADTVIATLRSLSGNAPMLPAWAFGFWQCRERYTSGTHLVETVKEFRARQLPMDVIVQDWQYWGKYGWGVMKFDEAHYPDPAGFIGALHRLHARFSISVWENLDKHSDIGMGFVSKGLFIPGSPWLDMLNREARAAHWKALHDNLFVHGVDSWWMDATEPENDALKGVRTVLGPGEFYRLTYPLYVSKGVYDGQRAADPEKRVCILTRSAFPGAQRYGVITWSGDVGGTWETFRRQIVAGLNYTVTGMPYWTTDIGGFFRPGPTQYTDERYQELLVRWFQWGAFTPIFRIHGYQTETEPWKYGAQVEGRMRAMLNLRYRLMPYIYSGAWQVTANGATMMRPLVMDFRTDSMALQQRAEYLFGPSLLVAPVTEPGEERWHTYLPGGVSWYDFWTGERFVGGRKVEVAAPLDRIPLFVKAGSILPLGPRLQYTGERPADTLEIRIYPGADGHFTLYEDENDAYRYERGMFSTITLDWSNARRALTIGRREGAFPGMLSTRVFRIVCVSSGHGIGEGELSSPDRVVRYDGTRAEVVLP